MDPNGKETIENKKKAIKGTDRLLDLFGCIGSFISGII